MGGGDLNLKKSWAVNIQSNQRKVWEAEKKAMDERRRVQEVMKEREEERAIEELRRLQMEAGGNSNLIDPKVAWMYQDQKGDNQEANEAYLLGKRRVDQIILKQDQPKDDSRQSDNILAGALSARDISSKAALDPLLAIEKQRTANLQALMADPVARRRLMKDLERSKNKEDRKKERRYEREDDGEYDRHYRKKRRRYSEESDGERPDRRRKRDEGESARSKSRRDRDDHDYDHETDRHESRRHRDRGERKERINTEDDYRRTSGRYRDEIDGDRGGHRSRQTDRRLSNSRSQSPYRYRQQERPALRNVHSSRELREDGKREANTDAEVRAAKLAAMSANASDLEELRNRRLAEMEARDAADKKREDRRRDTRGDRFVDGLREQAETKGLGDGLQRAGGGLSRLQAGI